MLVELVWLTNAWRKSIVLPSSKTPVVSAELSLQLMKSVICKFSSFSRIGKNSKKHF